MRILIDTCVFLWAVDDDPRLPSGVRTELQDPANDVFLSVVSAWEIAPKNQLGKLPLSRPVDEFIDHFRRVHGIEALPLTEEAAVQLPKLPLHHTDPFDRMLICQAVVQGLALFTPDPYFRLYPVRTFWA